MKIGRFHYGFGIKIDRPFGPVNTSIILYKYPRYFHIFYVTLAFFLDFYRHIEFVILTRYSRDRFTTNVYTSYQWTSEIIYESYLCHGVIIIVVVTRAPTSNNEGRLKKKKNRFPRERR